MALHLAIRVDSRDPIGTRSAVFAGISDLGGKEGQRDLEKDQRQGIVPAGITQDDAVGHANDGVQLRLAVWCTSAHAPDYSGPGVRSEARASAGGANRDRKSTRLNSSHVASSYAVFCLKKKKTKTQYNTKPPKYNRTNYSHLCYIYRSINTRNQTTYKKIC